MINLNYDWIRSIINSCRTDSNLACDRSGLWGGCQGLFASLYNKKRDADLSVPASRDPT